MIVTASLDFTNGSLTGVTFSDGSDTTYTTLVETSIAYTNEVPTSTDRIVAARGSCAIVKASPVSVSRAVRRLAESTYQR